MEEGKSLKTIFDEALEKNEVDIEELAQLTGVSSHYINALKNLETDKLPAAPYIRGYIKKISKALRLDPNEIWHLYKNELDHKTSGGFDKLPANRFAIKHINKKTIVWAILGVLAAIYIVLNYNNLFGQLTLKITNPPSDSTITVNDPVFDLAGSINPKDKLTINGVEVLTDSYSGKFLYPYNLQPTLNVIEFKVKKILGQEKIETRQIYYQVGE
ncbi:MAG: helix-turn-helix transcriptional regulator [Candidatus Pacebacteria bacterium]|nr:helix-turn-helix transcriptional regulator [Candidatus Paceibacterota bacterium]